MDRPSPQRWVGVAVLPIVGFILLWWAHQQTIDLLSPAYVSPWTVLSWLLTIVAAGLMFGLAVTFSGTHKGSPHLGTILVAAIVPVAIVVQFFGFVALGWSPWWFNVFGTFLITPATAMVSCVVLGFLAVALVAPRLSRPD